MFQQQHALLEEGSQQASRLPLLWLCQDPDNSCGFYLFPFKYCVYTVGWASLDGKDWLSHKDQSVTSAWSSQCMHLQSHLGSHGKPIFPILLCAQHFTCLLAQQLDLICLAAILTINSISPLISCAPNCLKIPP